MKTAPAECEQRMQETNLEDIAGEASDSESDLQVASLYLSLCLCPPCIPYRTGGLIVTPFIFHASCVSY